MEENNPVLVDELVVLSKFEGDAIPDNEFERVTIHNGVVVSHDEVLNGIITGPVVDSDIVGQDIGTLTQ